MENAEYHELQIYPYVVTGIYYEAETDWPSEFEVQSVKVVDSQINLYQYLDQSELTWFESEALSIIERWY